MENGKAKYKSITADTRTDCEKAITEFRENKANQLCKNVALTVGEAVDMYIDLHQNLSQSTLSAYHKIRKFAFQDLMPISVDIVDDLVMQRAVNTECKRATRRKTPLTAKTIKNEYGLISAALKLLCNKSFNVVLPKYSRNISDYPDPMEIIRLIRNTDIELPCMLAIWLSFSLSEVRGIHYRAIKNGIIHIDQVVIDVDGLPIIKSVAKAENRIRKISAPQYILDLINKDAGYQRFLETNRDDLLIRMTGSQLAKRFRNLMLKNGIDITFHGLRHLNASVMCQLNVPEKYAMERGGWSTPYVMKSVYQHTFSTERVKIDGVIDNHFHSMIDKLDRDNSGT